MAVNRMNTGVEHINIFQNKDYLFHNELSSDMISSDFF